MAGNAAAIKQLVRERAGSYGKDMLRRVWGVRKNGSALELPAQAAAGNPLLAVMWARLQESCRLFYASGGLLGWLSPTSPACHHDHHQSASLPALLASSVARRIR